MHLSVLASILAGGAIAQPKPVGGLAAGAPIPAFSLRDQNGVERKFEDVRGPKGAMLVFYRSADW
ncbi:MAG: hypothetical protein SGI92_13625 [Bryobacteraceae bacterium]|nr:hypothetical protein [Bryobacteraceae bacterium]